MVQSWDGVWHEDADNPVTGPTLTVNGQWINVKPNFGAHFYCYKRTTSKKIDRNTTGTYALQKIQDEEGGSWRDADPKDLEHFSFIGSTSIFSKSYGTFWRDCVDTPIKEEPAFHKTKPFYIGATVVIVAALLAAAIAFGLKIGKFI